MSIARFLNAARLPPYAPVVVLCALACALCVSTYSVYGHTWDEPEHLAAGIALLDTGEYPYDQQHPPLARIAMAIGPYLAGARSHGNAGPSGEEEGRDILYDGHYDLYLALARIGMLPFLVLTIFTAWQWTRRLHGEAAGLLAATLVSFTPTLIGHAAVAALDVPMVGTTFFALYLLWNWFDKPGLKNAAAFGIAAGFAAGTKLSSIPFLGCTALAWWIASVVYHRRTSANGGVPTAFSPLSTVALGHAAAAAGCAAIALFACFGFNADHVVASFKNLLEHNQSGHLSYFMGELRRSGWWDFYLIALGVKTPIPLLLMGLAGSVWFTRQALKKNNWLLAAPTMAWLAIFLFASAYSHINIGVRHVLIVMPLLAIPAAAFATELWQKFPQVIPRIALCAIVGSQAITMAAVKPDFLPYFNALAGAHPEKLLIDSDLDWGQDLRRLKKALTERNIRHFSFVYRGTSDLQREGFPSFEFLWPKQRATGWIAVTLLAKATGSEDGGYDWLNAYKPVARIGKSIDLYYVEP